MADLPELSAPSVARNGGTKATPLKIDEPYLHEHPKTKVLYYRHEFPAHLRPYVPGSRREVKVSLGSRSILTPGVAEKFREAAHEYAALYTRAVKLKEEAYDRLAAHDITRLVAIFSHEALDDDDKGRWDPSGRELYNGAAAQLRAAGIAYTTPWEGREAQRWALKRRETIEPALAHYKAMRAAGDLEAIVTYWRDEAKDLADAHGYLLDPADTAGFAALCRALNDAAIATRNDMVTRLDGDDYPPTPPEPQAPKGPVVAVPAAMKTQTFKAIVEGMLSNPRHSGIGIPTRAQVSTALRYLHDILGDPRPEEITRAAVSDWLDVISQRPAFVTAAERVMPLRDLVTRYEGQEVKRASPATLEKHCGVLSKRWSHAAKEGYISEALPNPFAGRSFDAGTSGPKKNDGFSVAELRGIFGLPFFTGGPQPRWGRGEAAYWLPLIALYTGARPEEFAQLVLADIVKDAEVDRMVFSFEGTSEHPEKGQQRLKTKEKGTGPRAFPIPEGLIALGFLDYVEWLRTQGGDALFPQLRVRNKFNRLYPSFGEKWCEALYAHGILERRAGRKPMREFRDTFVTGARISRIPEEAIAYLIGHATAGSNQPRMTRKYGKLSSHATWIDDYRPLIDVLALVKPWRPPA